MLQSQSSTPRTATKVEPLNMASLGLYRIARELPDGGKCFEAMIVAQSLEDAIDFQDGIGKVLRVEKLCDVLFAGAKNKGPIFAS